MTFNNTKFELLMLQGDDDLSKEQGSNAPPESVALVIRCQSTVTLQADMSVHERQNCCYKRINNTDIIFNSKPSSTRPSMAPIHVIYQQSIIAHV